MASELQKQAERRARAVPILAALRRAYPDARCSLDFSSPLELLVATILSAQCTDERVNLVTKQLFKKYRTAADYARAPIEELEQDIKQTGFYRNKAKHIQAAAELIATRFGGEVPRAMADLLSLPGVARKTANVVQGNAFGIVEGVVVDTHVGRLSRRMDLTDSEEPAKVEHDLMAIIPRADWLDLSHIFIYHGRAICQARKPLCQVCTVARWCPTGAATNGTALEVPTTGA